MVFVAEMAFSPAVAALGAIQLCSLMAISNDNREFKFMAHPWEFRSSHSDCQKSSSARHSSLVFEATRDS